MASVITLHIRLEEIHPPIVRELQVDGDLSMADLHGAIQVAFGWREQHSHLFHDGEAPGIRPETAVSIAEAVADGPIWYEYDSGAKKECSGWTHRITASAPATAIGELRPVTLIGGQRRGPIEDPAAPCPWFPPTPESFDAPSIQAELDSYFGYRADERDPHDLSGLVVADDLRGPGDLKPDALLADFASGLPASIRSEFRQYARRTGLLDAVQLSPEIREQLVAPFARLLDAVGPESITLSAREDTTPPHRRLRDAAIRLGLVRTLHGKLVRTGHGNRAAGSTDELWEALTSRILLKISPGAQVAGTALLLTYAAPRAERAFGDDQRWRDIAFVLEASGWAPGGDPHASFDQRQIYDIVRPVTDVLYSLGSTVGATGWPPARFPAPQLADFARAALHGPAGIRSGSTTRYR